jgi:hypothetical protein
MDNAVTTALFAFGKRLRGDALKLFELRTAGIAFIFIGWHGGTISFDVFTTDQKYFVRRCWGNE